jgi:hypothetical protein
MPTFCRHNRLLQNCPICAREQDVELRAILSSSAPPSGEPRARTPGRGGVARARRSGAAGGAAAGLTVRRLRHTVDDGYRSPLLPGLKSSEEARRLAHELAFAAVRLERLAANPPGLYAEVANPAIDVEERIWLSFLIAYLCPLEQDDPFAAIRRARTSWSSGHEPALDAIETGPRSTHLPTAGTRALDAYRTWAQRFGSQAAAFAGDPAWSPDRRFSRAFERLALPGLHRGARFEHLMTLGVLGVCELSASQLELGGDDEVTIASKRALGIGDPLLLERRAATLAEACQVPLGSLDLALFNWEKGVRATVGLGPSAQTDPALAAHIEAVCGLEPEH